MSRLFAGSLLLFLQLRINGVDLPTALVGDLLIFAGLGVEGRSPAAGLCQIAALTAAAAMGALWLGALAGFEPALPLGMLFQMLVTFLLTRWVGEQAPLREWGSGRVRSLRRAWRLMAGASVLALPLATVSEGLEALAVALALAAIARYLCIFYRLWRDGAPVQGRAPQEETP